MRKHLIHQVYSPSICAISMLFPSRHDLTLSLKICKFCSTKLSVWPRIASRATWVNWFSYSIFKMNKAMNLVIFSMKFSSSPCSLSFTNLSPSSPWLKWRFSFWIWSSTAASANLCFRRKCDLKDSNFLNVWLQCTHDIRKLGRCFEQTLCVGITSWMYVLKVERKISSQKLHFFTKTY